MQQAVISLQDLSKRFGAIPAVSGIHLDVLPGEIMGFLGPNGAGKTTTIRLMTGFLRPTAGSVRLLGHEMAEPKGALLARRKLGFVPDVAGLDPGATGLRLLDDLARLQGGPPIDRLELTEALELNPHDLRRPMGRLSRGTRQKINIVQGLQHRPDLLILDEPAEGLDPLAKRALFNLLGKARDRGATIFFSSHVLSEVEEMCTRVALIRAGRLIAVDWIASMRAHLGRRVSVRFGPAAPAQVEQQLSSLPTVSGISSQDGHYTFRVSELPPLLSLLCGMPVEELTIEAPTLDEVFLEYYRPRGGFTGG